MVSSYLLNMITYVKIKTFSDSLVRAVVFLGIYVVLVNGLKERFVVQIAIRLSKPKA